MNKIYLCISSVLFLLLFQYAGAQQYRWLTGGGSTDLLSNGAIKGEWVTHMCTDDNNNLYALALVGDYSIKADTFYLSKSFNARVYDSWNILFMSYDCNGNMRFAKLLESTSNNHCIGLAYESGNIYVAGDLYDTGKRIGYDATIPGKYQFSFTAKFDTSGNYKWIQFIGPDSISTVLGAYAYGSLATDGQGNVHRYATMRAGVKITPSITSQWATYDLKYDPNGNLLDVKRLQSVDSPYLVNRVQIDKTTNKYYALFEYAGGTTTRSGTILAAFNPNGTLIWKDTTNPRAVFVSFRNIQNDGIYFAGFGYVQFGGFKVGSSSINGTTFSFGPISILGKIDAANGKIQWMYKMECANTTHALFDLEVLPDKSIAAVGIVGGTVIYKHATTDTITGTSGEGDNPLFVNIDSNGLLIEWNQLHGNGSYDNSKVMTSDKIGNVYYGGEVISDMQGGNLPKYTANGGNSDYFLGKFGYDCKCTAPAFPNANFTYIITDSLKKEVQFTFTGTTPNDSVYWQFGDGADTMLAGPAHTFSDTGTYVVCVKVHVPCGRKKVCQTIYVPFKDTSNSIATVNNLPGVKIYPNPAKNSLVIEGAETGSTIEVYSIIGTKVYNYTIASHRQVIDISTLPEGNYIIQITDVNGRRMTGKVLKQ